MADAFDKVRDSLTVSATLRQNPITGTRKQTHLMWGNGFGFITSLQTNKSLVKVGRAHIWSWIN